MTRAFVYISYFDAARWRADLEITQKSTSPDSILCFSMRWLQTRRTTSLCLVTQEPGSVSVCLSSIKITLFIPHFSVHNNIFYYAEHCRRTMLYFGIHKINVPYYELTGRPFFCEFVVWNKNSFICRRLVWLELQEHWSRLYNRSILCEKLTTLIDYILSVYNFIHNTIYMPVRRAGGRRAGGRTNEYIGIMIMWL